MKQLTIDPLINIPASVVTAALNVVSYLKSHNVRYAKIHELTYGTPPGDAEELVDLSDRENAEIDRLIRLVESLQQLLAVRTRDLEDALTQRNAHRATIQQLEGEIHRFEVADKADMQLRIRKIRKHLDLLEQGVANG